jgi:hypothetical protein
LRRQPPKTRLRPCHATIPVSATTIQPFDTINPAP